MTKNDSEDCIKNIDILIKQTEVFIEMACERKKYDSSAFYRDLKKDMEKQIVILKNISNDKI